MNSIPDSFLAIDEHGRFLENEERVSDQERVQRLFENLKYTDNGTLISHDGERGYIVEAFEAPWVLIDLKVESSQLIGLNTYGFSAALDPQSFYFDEWDRVHGLSQSGIAFVMLRSAQEKFFDYLEEFDDDSFAFQGVRYYPEPAFLSADEFRSPTKWSEIYQEMPIPNWDLQMAHPAFKDMLPRLRLSKSRTLVLGCGEGHDAAYLAQEGHLVTAVDFSEAALTRARQKYGHLSIEFVQADAFDLPRSFDKNFDLILEHTLFCAVPPDKRNDLIKSWNRCLITGGYLMGVFFAAEKRTGPPYGATEWELRKRLEKDYHFLFWGRWKKSPERRQGRELFVLAQKK